MKHIATRLLSVMGHSLTREEDCASVARLAELTQLNTTQVSDACAVLRRNGLARHVRHQCYALTTAGRAAAADDADIWRGPRAPTGVSKPRADSLIQRAWNAMRIKRKFDLAELVLLAGREEKSARASVTNYCYALARAGYLLPIKAQGSTHGKLGASRRYLLIRDSGPYAPRWQKAKKAVADVNNGEMYSLEAQA